MRKKISSLTKSARTKSVQVHRYLKFAKDKTGSGTRALHEKGKEKYASVRSKVFSAANFLHEKAKQPHPRLHRKKENAIRGLERFSFLFSNWFAITNGIQVIIIALLLFLLWNLFQPPENQLLLIDQTTVIATGTICYAILTWVLISKTVKASQLQLMPDVRFGAEAVGNCLTVYFKNHSQRSAKHLEMKVAIRVKKDFFASLSQRWIFESYFSNDLFPGEKKECPIMEQFFRITKTKEGADGYSGEKIIEVKKGNPTKFEIQLVCSYCSVAGNETRGCTETYGLGIKDKCIDLQKKKDDFHTITDS